MSWRALPKVLELRFAFCQRAHGSSGVRAFVESNYVAMKSANPRLPILVREAHDTIPRVTARYALGREHTLYLEGLTEMEIKRKVETLAQ